MTSPVVNQLPAFSDSISQPALPTEISGLTDFDILGAGVADLTNSLDLDLTTEFELDLGTELETTLLPDEYNDNVLASGNLGDFDLGLADLNMEQPLTPVTVKKEPVMEIPQPHPKLPLEPQIVEEPQALNLDSITIPDNFSSSTFQAPSQNAPLTPMNTWSIDEVQQWLASQSFGHLYAENFRNAGVDGSALLRLEETYMIEVLGIDKVFHRIRVLRDIADFLQPFSINQGDGGPTYSRLLRFQPYDLKAWCVKLPWAANYPNLFESQNITGEILANQTIQTLKEWGIKNLHAKRFLSEINDVRSGQQEACDRVESVWNTTEKINGRYRLLYKHLKPRYRKKTRKRKRKVTHQSSGNDSPENWAVDDVLEWVKNFNWGGMYLEAFRQCQVDGSVLLRLNAQLLEEVFGLSIQAQQVEMITRIDELRSISLRGWLREKCVDDWLRGEGITTQQPVKRMRSAEPTPQVAPACVLCGKQDNIMRCSKCKKAFYCSREHQVEHWPVHAAHCVPTD